MPSLADLVRSFLCIAGLFSAFATSCLAQTPAPPSPPSTEAARAALLDRVIDNEKKSDEALNLYERVERVEIRKNASDPTSNEVKVSRVVPAGTGVDHIPMGLDGKPANLEAYHKELLKLERALSWASNDGDAQRNAYEKVEKRQKDRDALIDATRAAFLYTFLSAENRDGRVLYKYSISPNPAYKPTSRATSVFAKVHGLVWIDPVAGQLFRVEGEVTEDISFGFILAKIYKGSRFMQERREVEPGLWMPCVTEYDFDGRKFFSSISVHERTFYSQFHRIGPPKEAVAEIRAELGKTFSAVPDP